MDKINYITEPYDEEDTQNTQRVPTITYDHIMNRLTRHFIRQENSNTIHRTPQPQIEQRVCSASAHITEKINKKMNSEKMPGYVKPYRGQPPTGQLNTPAFKQRPGNINEKDKGSEIGMPNNINKQEMENKLLLMRKIALHNNKVMSDRNKASKTQLKFK